MFCGINGCVNSADIYGYEQLYSGKPRRKLAINECPFISNGQSSFDSVARLETMHSKMSTSLAVLLLAAMVAVGQAKQLIFKNRMGETVWVGSLGNAGKPPIDGGGWEMRPGTTKTVNVADDWAGRFWGRTKCDRNGNCQTGNCGGIKCAGRGGEPPATLAEFTFKGHQGQDFYDVSLVDGFNIKVSIEPTVAAKGGYRCAKCRCTANINANCPSKLRLVKGGRTVGCKSACLAFNTDAYCCRGAHNREATCRSRDWPRDYPKEVFKRACPDAYSYAYDDQKSTYTCEKTGYNIIFG